MCHGREVMDFPGGSEGKVSTYNAGDPVWSLGWEDPLEKEMATHSSTLAWKIPWMEEHCRLPSLGSQRVRHNWTTSLSLSSHVWFYLTPWTTAHQAALSSIISQTLLRFMSIELMMLSNYLILYCSLSFCLPSFPPSGPFPMSWLFASDGQSIGVSVPALVFPINIQEWFPLGLTGLIYLWATDSQESSPAPQFKSISSSALNLLYSPALTPVHDCRKNHNLTIWTFVGKVMYLLFNMLSRFVIAFLSRNKHPLISWLQLPSAVILEPKKIKTVTASTFHPSVNICHEVMELDVRILVFWVSSEYFTLLFHPHQKLFILFFY